MGGGRGKMFGALLRAVDFLIAAAVVLTCIEVLVEVAFRYLFHLPLPWGAELSQTLLVWVTFVGAASALARGEHMAIGLAVQRIPSPRLREIVRVTGRLAVLGFLGLGVWAGVLVTRRTWALQTTALQIPAGVLYLAFPVGCLLMSLIVLRELSRGGKE